MLRISSIQNPTLGGAASLAKERIPADNYFSDTRISTYADLLNTLIQQGLNIIVVGLADSSPTAHGYDTTKVDLLNIEQSACDTVQTRKNFFWDITGKLDEDLNYTLVGKYDVVCFECLPLRTYTEQSFKNVHAMLKKGGIFIVHGWQPEPWRKSVFTKTALRNLANDGLTIQQISPQQQDLKYVKPYHTTWFTKTPPDTDVYVFSTNVNLSDSDSD